MLGVFKLPEPVLIRKSTRQRKKNCLGDFEYGAALGTDARSGEFCENNQALESVCSTKSVSSSQQTERDINRTKKKHDNHKDSIPCKDKQHIYNTETVRSAHEDKQLYAVESIETLEDIPARESGRKRKEKYRKKDSDTSLTELSKKARRCREVIPNKDEKQESSIRKCRNNMKGPHEYSKKTLEPSKNLSADKLMRTKNKTTENIKSNHDIIYSKPGKGKQNANEAFEKREVKKPGGRPKKSTELLEKTETAVKDEESINENVEVREVRKPRGRPRKSTEPVEKKTQTVVKGKQSINEDVEVREVKKPRGRPRKITEPSEEKNQAAVKGKESTNEDVEVREVKNPRGRPGKNTEPLEKKDQADVNDKESTCEDAELKEVKKPRGRPTKNTEPLEKKGQVDGDSKQGTGEDAEIGDVKNPRGRPPKNKEPLSDVEVGKMKGGSGRPTKNLKLNENIFEISINVHLRRSARERKTHYMYGDDSFYDFDESTSWLNPCRVKRNKNKIKAQQTTSDTGEAKKSRIQKSTQKQNSKKLPETENLKLDEKLTRRAVVRIESLKDKRSSSVKENKKEADKQDIHSGRGRAEKTKNINKKTGKKAEQQVKINQKLMEKTQPGAAQGAEGMWHYLC